MRETLRSALTIALALLAVASMVSGAAGLMAPDQPHTAHNHNHDAERADPLPTLSPIGSASASHQCSEAVGLNLALRSDLTTAQKAAKIVGGCDPYHGTTGTDSIDANQTKSELVQRAATTRQHVNTTMDSFDNNYQNMEAIARLEFQAAYYRALENGSSRSAAKIAANESIEDYFTVKEKQLMNSAETMVTDWHSYDSLESNDSTIDGKFISQAGNTNANSLVSNKMQETITLVNGSTMSISTHAGYLFTLGNSQTNTLYVSQDGDFDTYKEITSPTNQEWVERRQKLHDASDSVRAETQQYIDNTFTDYQTGDVNATELVDANTLEREFSGDNSQSWATLALATTSGVDPPEDLDGVGTFNVSYSGSTETGVLLADTTKTDLIETGTTYDGSAWSVTPKIVTESGAIKPLNGTFTVDAITSPSGETQQNATYTEVKYKTTNTSEYKSLMTELDSVRAELEAREANRGDGGLGIGLPDLGLGVPDSVLLIGGGIALFLLLRD